MTSTRDPHPPNDLAATDGSMSRHEAVSEAGRLQADVLAIRLNPGLPAAIAARPELGHQLDDVILRLQAVHEDIHQEIQGEMRAMCADDGDGDDGPVSASGGEQLDPIEFARTIRRQRLERRRADGEARRARVAARLARMPVLSSVSLPDGASGSGAHAYAVVDSADPTAVLDLITIEPGPVVRVRTGSQWVESLEMLKRLTGLTPPSLVELNADALSAMLVQVDG